MNHTQYKMPLWLSGHGRSFCYGSAIAYGEEKSGGTEPMEAETEDKTQYPRE